MQPWRAAKRWDRSLWPESWRIPAPVRGSEGAANAAAALSGWQCRPHRAPLHAEGAANAAAAHSEPRAEPRLRGMPLAARRAPKEEPAIRDVPSTSVARPRSGAADEGPSDGRPRCPPSWPCARDRALRTRHRQKARAEVMPLCWSAAAIFSRADLWICDTRLSLIPNSPPISFMVSSLA